MNCGANVPFEWELLRVWRAAGSGGGAASGAEKAWVRDETDSLWLLGAVTGEDDRSRAVCAAGMTGGGGGGGAD